MSPLSAIIASNKDKVECIRMRTFFFLLRLSWLKIYFSAVCSLSTWGESLSLLLWASEWLLLGINTALCYDFCSLFMCLPWWSTSADWNSKSIPVCEKWLEKMNLQCVSSLSCCLCLLGWGPRVKASRIPGVSPRVETQNKQLNANREAEQGRWRGSKLAEGHTQDQCVNIKKPL